MSSKAVAPAAPKPKEIPDIIVNPNIKQQYEVSRGEPKGQKKDLT